jgi:membrane-bound lytic murein transglycosylase B
MHAIAVDCADAATCEGDFGAFLSAMSREAAAAGIPRTVIDSALAGLMGQERAE